MTPDAATERSAILDRPRSTTPPRWSVPASVGIGVMVATTIVWAAVAIATVVRSSNDDQVLDEIAPAAAPVDTFTSEGFE